MGALSGTPVWIMLLGRIIGALCLTQIAAAQLTNGLYAEFDTSMGSFTCRLDYAEAPLTVANFVSLVEGSQNWVTPEGAVKSGNYYDGLIFHRVISDFMIQGGDPLGTGTGGPGYAFPDQISTNILHTSAGILSMANSGPNSNGSQFFITLAPTPWLDGKHAVFGEVIGGMNVVSNIGVVATDADDRPLSQVVMNSVRILREGSEAEAFDPTSQPLPMVSALPVTLNGDIRVATSNQCEQLIYDSMNLVDWTSFEESYTPFAAGDLVAEIPADAHCGFYRGAQIKFPEGASKEISGRVITLDIGSEVVFVPTADGTGTCSLNGSPGVIQTWRYDPSRVGHMFFTDIMVPFSLEFEYATPSNGVVTGWFYNSGWRPLSGTFTDAPIAP